MQSSSVISETQMQIDDSIMSKGNHPQMAKNIESSEIW